MMNLFKKRKNNQKSEIDFILPIFTKKNIRNCNNYKEIFSFLSGLLRNAKRIRNKMNETLEDTKCEIWKYFFIN